MESLQERKRKSSGSECVENGKTQQTEESTSAPTPTKMLKNEFFSKENPWPKCRKLNQSASIETSTKSQKVMTNSNNESLASTIEVSSKDSDESNEESKNLQSLESSSVNISLNDNEKNSADKVLTSSEEVILNSSEINDSGIVSMECENTNEKSFNTTLTQDNEKSSDKISTNTEKKVSNSAEKCSAVSSGFISMESVKDNLHKSLDSVNTTTNKNDATSVNNESSAASNANISTGNNKQSQRSRQLSNALSYIETSNINKEDMNEGLRFATDCAIPIRDGIYFFLENGYFEESFIEENRNIYEIFIKCFKTYLEHLTPIHNQFKIKDIEDERVRISDTLFQDDDRQNFLYFWTTTQQELDQKCTNKMNNMNNMNDMNTKFWGKANIHKYILEKPENGHNTKISGAFVVRLNSSVNEAQVSEIELIEDEVLVKKLLKDTWK